MQTLPSSLIIPVPVDGGVFPVVGGLKEGIGIICFSINALNPLLAITRAEVALPNASRQFSVEIIFLASSRLVLASAKWSLAIFRRYSAIADEEEIFSSNLEIALAASLIVASTFSLVKFSMLVAILSPTASIRALKLALSVSCPISSKIFRRSKASPGNLFKIVGEKTFVLSDSFRLLILFSNFSIKASFVL